MAFNDVWKSVQKEVGAFFGGRWQLVTLGIARKDLNIMPSAKPHEAAARIEQVAVSCGCTPAAVRAVTCTCGRGIGNVQLHAELCANQLLPARTAEAKAAEEADEDVKADGGDDDSKVSHVDGKPATAGDSDGDGDGDGGSDGGSGGGSGGGGSSAANRQVVPAQLQSMSDKGFIDLSQPWSVAGTAGIELPLLLWLVACSGQLRVRGLQAGMLQGFSLATAACSGVASDRGSISSMLKWVCVMALSGGLLCRWGGISARNSLYSVAAASFVTSAVGHWQRLRRPRQPPMAFHASVEAVHKAPVVPAAITLQYNRTAPHIPRQLVADAASATTLITIEFTASENADPFELGDFSGRIQLVYAELVQLTMAREALGIPEDHPDWPPQFVAKCVPPGKDGNDSKQALLRCTMKLPVDVIPALARDDFAKELIHNVASASLSLSSAHDAAKHCVTAHVDSTVRYSALPGPFAKVASILGIRGAHVHASGSPGTAIPMKFLEHEELQRLIGLTQNWPVVTHTLEGLRDLFVGDCIMKVESPTAVSMLTLEYDAMLHECMPKQT